MRGEDSQSVEILPHHFFKFYVVYEGRESESLDGGGNYRYRYHHTGSDGSCRANVSFSVSCTWYPYKSGLINIPVP